MARRAWARPVRGQWVGSCLHHLAKTVPGCDPRIGHASWVEVVSEAVTESRKVRRSRQDAIGAAAQSLANARKALAEANSRNLDATTIAILKGHEEQAIT